MDCGTAAQCRDIVLQLLTIGISNGAVIALNALGVTLVYGAVRMINFAHGDVFALTTVVVTFIIDRLGLQPGAQPLALVGGLLAALVASLVVGAGLNVAVERAAFRPFRGGSRLAPLIATLSLSFILYQVALVWRKLQPDWIRTEHRSVPGVPEVPLRRIPELLADQNLVTWFGLPLRVTYTLKDLLVLVLAITVTLAVGAWLRWTRLGRALRACAQDPELAELCGVDRERMIRLVFALGGALAGAAAFVFAVYYERPFAQHGVQSGLIALTAAVLGGIGRPRGAFWSGLLLGIMAAFSDFFLAAQWTPVLILASLIVMLAVRPTGLVGDVQNTEIATPPPADSIVQRRAGRTSGRSRWVVWGLIALGLGYPLVDRLGQWHQQMFVTGMLILVLLALGLNVLLGFTGLLDLGYAACFALGAYTAAILTSPGGWWSNHVPGEFGLVVLASGGIAALCGLFLGGLAWRLRGEYLALVTLAFGQLVVRVLRNLDRWTGGSGGLAALPPPRLFGYTLRQPVLWYYLVLGVVMLVALASQRLLASRLGRAWAALSSDETAAWSCGINPTRTKTLAFVVGTTIAGVAGALFASIFSYAAPDQAEVTLSVMVLAMVVIGGAGHVPGVIIGALLVAGYDQYGVRLLGQGFDWIGQLLHTSVFAALDPRALSVGSFGLVLYWTIRLRARRAMV